MNRWSLPGPETFLSELQEDLREGKSLVVALPSYGIDGVCEKLRQKLADEGWSVSTPMLATSKDPLEQLFDDLCLDDGEAGRRTVGVLAQKIPASQVVLVEGICVDTWPAWRKLLTEYEAVSRSISRFDRPLIVAITTGIALADQSAGGVALKTHSWYGIVGELDMLLYVTALLRKRSAIDARTKIVSRIVAKLALWDFTLADQLVEQKEADFFSPIDLIGKLAAICEVTSILGRTWERGGLQKYDGVEMLHPFVLAKDSVLAPIITKRVWAAQASELLPMLELQRSALAKRMQRLVPKVLNVDGEIVKDLDDLEFGQLAFVARQHKLGKELTRLTTKWQVFRNSLAHMRLLEEHEALDTELLTLRDSSFDA